MREIKFRAWDWEKMVQLHIIGLQHEHEANPCIYKYKAGDESSEELLYYSDSKPMQYTWLKDKNGKEIYEGDILQWDTTYIGSGIGAVKFNYGKFYIPFMDCILPHDKESEVIGNIYKNPELLKEQSWRT